MSKNAIRRCQLSLNKILYITRDAGLTKKVWERSQKLAILNQLQTHFKAKREISVGTPFPRVPAPLHAYI